MKDRGIVFKPDKLFLTLYEILYRNVLQTQNDIADDGIAHKYHHIDERGQ